MQTKGELTFSAPGPISWQARHSPNKILLYWVGTIVFQGLWFCALEYTENHNPEFESVLGLFLTLLFLDIFLSI